MRYPPDMVTAIHDARMATASEEVAARRLRRRVPRIVPAIPSMPGEA